MQWIKVVGFGLVFLIINELCVLKKTSQNKIKVVVTFFVGYVQGGPLKGIIDFRL